MNGWLEAESQAIFASSNSTSENTSATSAKLRDLASQALIYSSIFDRQTLSQSAFSFFEQRGLSSVFFEAFVPLILTRKVLRVGTELISSLTRSALSRGDTREVEDCLICLPLHSLDLDSTVRLSRSYRLPRVLIHICSRALGDFVSPIDTFLPFLERTPDTLTASEMQEQKRVCISLSLPFSPFFPPSLSLSLFPSLTLSPSLSLT